MPPPPPAQESMDPLPDPFYEALEALAKKYNVAFVAEGRPFLTSQGVTALTPGADSAPDATPAPTEKAGEAADPAHDAGAVADKAGDAPPRADLAQDEEVQRLARRFDYFVVRQGNVYLLAKRYTNPNELPEVSAEEYRVWVSHLFMSVWATRSVNINGHLETNHTEQSLIDIANAHLHDDAVSLRRSLTQDEFRDRLIRSLSGPGSELYMLTQNFYFASHIDYQHAALTLLEDTRLLDPVFHWQPLGQTPVFGFDTQFTPSGSIDFVPVSDMERVGVIPYGVPLPHADYMIRGDTQLPDPDPTDPALLSKEMKRFLDDNGRSSRAVTLGEALTEANKKVPKVPGYKIYQVDPIYAAKHVTLAGTERLSPETLIQAMATLYDLGVEHKRDDHVLLTTPVRPLPDRFIFIVYRQFDKFARQGIPAPILRAMHARFLNRRTKTANQEGTELLEYRTEAEFQRIAADYRNTALRMFRYLTEPKVKAQPKGRLRLARLGEREHMLFTFAQTASTYANACELTEIPIPLYVTHIDDFRANVIITGGIYHKGDAPTGPYINDPIYFSQIKRIGGFYTAPDDTARLALYATYRDPQTGLTQGPYLIFDGSLNYQFH